MAIGMTKIGSSVLVGSGGAATVSFTSIPNTYTDLLVKFSLRCGATGTRWNNSVVTFNGSPATVSNWVIGYNNGISASNYASGQLVFINHGDVDANTFGNGEMYISKYAGSNYKCTSSMLTAEANSADGAIGMVSGFISSTSVLTSITFTAQSNVYTENSTATLYGILKA